MSERTEIAKKKRELAVTLLQSKKNNEEIKAAIRDKFGNAISSGSLAELREMLELSGKNRKHNSITNRAVDELSISAKSEPCAEEVWVPNNQTTTKLHPALLTMLDIMRQENVASLAIKSDGHIKIHLIQEFMLARTT